MIKSRWLMSNFIGAICLAGTVSADDLDVPNSLAVGVDTINTANSQDMARILLHSVIETDPDNYSSNIPVDSDTRRDVFVSESAYDAIGVLYYGLKQCTGTFITIQTYADVQNRPLVLTAGHCVSGASAIEKFSMQYIDSQGHIQLYESRVAEIYSTRPPNGLTLQDVAILALVSDAPSDITPANLVPYFDGQVDLGDYVSKAGYSATRVGLTEDIDCEIVAIDDLDEDGQFAGTNCQMTSGDSGSPFVIASNNSQLTINGVTSGFTDSGMGIHQFVNTEILSGVPFLVETNPSTVCAFIDATSLNVRRQPEIADNIMTEFESGSIVSIRNEGNKWSYVEQGHYIGWVADRYLSPAPCN